VSKVKFGRTKPEKEEEEGGSAVFAVIEDKIGKLTEI
jgi:hypothetical protein